MIRFGLACRSTALEVWQRSALEALLALPDCELSLAIFVPAAPSSSRLPHPRWLASLCHPESLVCSDAADLFDGCESIAPGSAPSAVAAWADAGSRVAALELDFILNLGVLSLDESILAAPRWGTWTFDHDDRCRSRGEPPEYRPVLQRRLTTILSLSRLAVGSDDNRMLRCGRFRTVRSNYRVHVDRVYPVAAEWPAQLAGQLSRDPDALDRSTALEGTLESPSASIASGGVGGGLPLRLVARRLRRSLRRQFESQEWNVGWIRTPIAQLLESQERPQIEWAQQPADAHFWADPFGVKREGQRWVFFEVLDSADARGRIAALAVADADASEQGGAGTGSDSRREIGVWEWPHHLSYPFLLEHEGELFCVPETNEAGAVSLYRARSLPGDWEKVATLVEGVHVVDASVFPFEDRWWMICAAARGDAASELLIYCADELTGPWRPHAMNPVKIDVSSSRPGGTPFVVDGVLYRPAQDCSSGYGARIVIQKLDRLSEYDFSEHTVATLEPDPNGPFPDGLHTLSEFAGWTLVDGRRQRLDGWAAVRRLRSRFAAG